MTFKEFKLNKTKELKCNNWNDYLKHSGFNEKEINYKMTIEFVKYHVTKALKTAADNAIKMSSTRDTIINSYPLDNIK